MSFTIIICQHQTCLLLPVSPFKHSPINATACEITTFRPHYPELDLWARSDLNWQEGVFCLVITFIRVIECDITSY